MWKCFRSTVLLREPLSFFIVSGYRNSPRRHKDSKTRQTVRRLEFTILIVVTHKLVDVSMQFSFSLRIDSKVSKLLQLNSVGWEIRNALIALNLNCRNHEGQTSSGNLSGQLENQEVEFKSLKVKLSLKLKC
ncbi:hypothetical protein P8452_24103 [Trifolium repens]|nr:hypothetical protein P8452_24103 [Trifolium repens]